MAEDNLTLDEFGGAMLASEMPVELADKTASVKIHLANGQIEEERTYPRAADPSRFKG